MDTDLFSTEDNEGHEDFLIADGRRWTQMDADLNRMETRLLRLRLQSSSVHRHRFNTSATFRSAWLSAVSWRKRIKTGLTR